MAPVAQPGGALLVVALRDCADPLDGVAGDGRHLLRGFPLGEQPEHLPVAAGDRIAGVLITRGQFLRAQVWVDHELFWHTSIIHQDWVLGV
jgi:hypothetical protein